MMNCFVILRLTQAQYGAQTAVIIKAQSQQQQRTILKSPIGRSPLDRPVKEWTQSSKQMVIICDPLYQHFGVP
jgi:hypothetical protein